MRVEILSLMACAAIASSTGANNIAEMVDSAPSACSEAITACLSSAKISNPNAFAECYIKAGCMASESRLEAQQFSNNLDADRDGLELRRRQETSANNETPTQASTSAGKTTAKSAKTTNTDEKTTSEKTKTSAQKTTSVPSSAAATTTQDTTTSKSTTQPSTSTTESTSSSLTSTLDTTTSSTSSTSAESVTSGTTTGTNACSVTHTVSTKVCSYTQNKMVDCTPTTTAVSTCAPGKLCFSSVAGADVCMEKDNHLTTSGLIVAIAFGAGLSAALLATLVVGVRGWSKAKREAQVAAMMTSSRPDVEKSAVPPNQSGDNLPLIAPGGSRSDQQNYGEGRGAPRLHQGLGSLGQNQRPRY